MAENGLDRERLVWMFTRMRGSASSRSGSSGRSRTTPGVIRGHTHLADGAEASIVGSLAALAADDSC